MINRAIISFSTRPMSHWVTYGHCVFTYFGKRRNISLDGNENLKLIVVKTSEIICIHVSYWKERLDILFTRETMLCKFHLLTCCILEEKMLLHVEVAENKTNVEELYLLEYNSVQSVEKQSTFRRNMSPFIFRVEEWGEQETIAKLVAGRFFDPEDGGNMFLLNVGLHLTLHRCIPEDVTLHNHICVILRT
jgi:hypothetical protein